jgi:CRISPR-associated protein Cas2
MVVMVLEKVPTSLRGELTRWTLELKAGVFVGTVSAMVRDLLWQKVAKSLRAGGAVMIYTSDTEQGFQVRYAGDTSRTFIDFEGIWLVGIEEKQR